MRTSCLLLRLASLLLLVLGATILRAQQADDPVYFSVYFQESVTLSKQDPSTNLYGAHVKFYVTDETGAEVASYVSGPLDPQFSQNLVGPKVVAKLLPNKDYIFTADMDRKQSGGVYFAPVVPGLGEVFIDGYRGLFKSVDNSAGTSQLFQTFKVRFSLPNNYALSSAPDDLAAGAATSIIADKPIWYVGLGRLRDGSSAGAVGFRRPDFSNANIFTPAALYSAAPLSPEVDTILSGGVVRQVYSREVLLDINTVNGTTYTIDVYPRSQVTGQPGGPGTLCSFSGSAFITYTVSQNTTNGVTITRTEDSKIWETSLVLDGLTWTLRDWHVQGTALDSKITTAYSSTTAAVVSHTGPASGLSGDAAFSWSKTFTAYSWGRELTGSTLGASETTPLVSANSYYTTTSTSDGSYTGKLHWAKHSDGTWEKYTYINGDLAVVLPIFDGKVLRAYRPWLDVAATPETATTANSLYEDYEYSHLAKGGDANGVGATAWEYMTKSITTYAPGGTLLKKTTWDYTSRATTLNGQHVWASTQNDFSASSQSLTTIGKYYAPLATTWDYFKDKPVSVIHPNGRKDSYAYFRGTWNSANNSFSASADGNDRLVLCFHGQTAGGTAITAWTNNGVTWNIDSVSMVTGQSTVSESVIDTTGRTVFTGTNVFVSASSISRLAGVAYTYDLHGRLTNEVDVIRSVGSLKYETQRTYVAALLDTEIAPDGVQTNYVYDDLLRLTQNTTGVGGSAPYPAKVKTTKYDGVNRPVAAYSCACGTSPTRYYYDGAGRLMQKSESSPDPARPDLFTIYSYPSVTSSTVTGPTGANTTTNRYADGRIKSVTGTAQPPVYYDYSANSTGMLATQKHDNDSTMANGWTQDQYDLLGRTTKHSTPTYGWNSTSGVNNIIDLVPVYHSASGLLTSRSMTYRVNGGAMSPTHLYFYDGAGRLTDEGMDLDSSGTLTSTGNDRFTHYDNTFVDSSGWTNVAVTKTYANTDSSATELSRVVTRLTGFNGGLYDTTYGFAVGDVTSTDVNGQISFLKEFVLPSSLQHYTAVTMPGSSNVGWSKSINGYPAEGQMVSGARSKNEYDGLGRLATVKSRYDSATSAYAVSDTITYFENTSYVTARTVNGIITSMAYAWGTNGTSTVKISDAAGNYSYTLYNEMGLPKRVGGTASSPVQFNYDAIGRRTSMTTWRNGNAPDELNWPSGTGDTTTWTLETATGLVKSKIAADDSHVDFTYTALGQPLVRTSARNTTTTYSYYDGTTTAPGDVSHRTQELRSITYSGTTPATPRVFYTYNRSGLPKVINDGTSIGAYTAATTGSDAGHTFSYAAGQPFRVAGETLSSFYGSRVQTQQYDGVYRPAGFTLSGASGSGTELNQSYSYSAASGLPYQLTTTPLNQTLRTYTFGWKSNTEMFTGYTTPVTGGSYALGYDYHASTNLRSQVKNSFTTTTLSQSDLSYNTLGQIQTVKQSGTAFNDYYMDPADLTKNFVTNSFDYDAMGQLKTKATYRATVAAPVPGDELPGRRFEYRYDSMGNRKTAGATANNVANGGTADDYFANQLNQYSSVTNNTVRVFGAVGTNAAIKVAVAGAPSTGKLDRAWGADLVPAQGSSAVTGTATVYAAIPGTPDVIRTDSTKSWFIPPASQSFGYDSDGNLTSDGVWTYAYDAENRLVSMTSLLSAGAGHKRWNLAFQYDYLGRRVQKSVVNLDNASLNYTRRYVYNGWNLVAELDASGSALKRSYTWGLDLAGASAATGGVGALMQITEHTGTSNKNYFAAYDHNGNVSGLESDEGVLAASYEYGPFGEPLRSDAGVTDSTMKDNPFRFSTKFTDVETGLIYYGKRFYSPTIGRFINSDPIEEAGGINLYNFVGNNGISRVDILGMKTVCMPFTDPTAGNTSPTRQYICATDGKDDSDALPADAKTVYTGANFGFSSPGNRGTPTAYSPTVGKPPTSATSGMAYTDDNGVVHLPAFNVKDDSDDSSSYNPLAGSDFDLPQGFTPVANGHKWYLSAAKDIYFQQIANGPNGRGYTVKLVAPRNVNGTLVQRQRQRVAVSKGKTINRGGYEAWVVKDGTMGVIVEERIGSMVIEKFIPRTDTFFLPFDTSGIGSAEIETWAQFIPDKTPEDLEMKLGAGIWDGSGNGSYFSSTAPNGFSESGALHRGLFFSRPTNNDTWKRDRYF